jgi:hypothetical protein
MKIAVGVVAAVMLTMTFLASPAEARCGWNGYSWVCSRPYHPYWRRGYYYGPRYYRYRNHYRPYY